MSEREKEREDCQCDQDNVFWAPEHVKVERRENDMFWTPEYVNVRVEGMSHGEGRKKTFKLKVRNTGVM
jgi:predicted ATPase